MKIWYGYGSEHSMNLVMIGRFKDSESAHRTKEIIEQLTKQLEADVDAGLIEVGEGANRYTEDMLSTLTRVGVHIIGPAEVEQFGYDAEVNVDKDKLVITTDESDVSAFLKLLLERGARVEVYSAHDYPRTGYGRGE
ncbi:MAG: hypothetical protein JWL77_1817 [Chthonomonadaceae bacterium]|nr:hypothetical protein [Chthonomonadaceae bacterium]